MAGYAFMDGTAGELPLTFTCIMFVTALNIALVPVANSHGFEDQTSRDIWMAIKWLAILGNGGLIVVLAAAGVMHRHPSPIIFALLLGPCFTQARKFRPADTEPEPSTLDHRSKLWDDAVDPGYQMAILARAETFTSNQILVAGLIGGPLASCWFIARNCKVMKQPFISILFTWIGYVSTVLLMPMSFWIVPSIPKAFPAITFSAIIAGILKAYAYVFQDDTIAEARRLGAREMSMTYVWMKSRRFGYASIAICLLVALVIFQFYRK